MKAITLNTLHNMLYAEFTQLQSVERLLNKEGQDTHKALFDLINIVPFYDDLKDYALDKRVNMLLAKYSHCRSIQTYARILTKASVPFPEVEDWDDFETGK